MTFHTDHDARRYQRSGEHGNHDPYRRLVWDQMDHLLWKTVSIVIIRKVVQATMGSIARVQICYTDLPAFLQNLHREIPVYGAFLEGENIYEKKLGQKGILVIGNESKGISADLEGFISEKIYIHLIPPIITCSIPQNHWMHQLLQRLSVPSSGEGQKRNEAFPIPSTWTILKIWTRFTKRTFHTVFAFNFLSCYCVRGTELPNENKVYRETIKTVLLF